MKYLNKDITFMYEKLSLVRKSDIAFPAKISYAIVRNFKTLTSIYEDIMRTREALILANGILVEEKGYYEVSPEKREFVDEELRSLGEAENEISLTMIKMSDIEALNLPIDIMEGLYCMIEDEG